MRHTYLLILATVFAFNTCAVLAEPELTIYTAKTIITLDSVKPETTAVAVNASNIVASGSLAELKKKFKSHAYTVNTQFADKVIVPGFLAQHIHPFLAALTLTSNVIAIEDWQLPSGMSPGVRTAKGYVERLRQAEAETKQGEPLISWGFHHYFHGKLTLADLDKISTTRPIVIWHRSAHEFILNSAALKEYGISEPLIETFSESAQEQTNLAEGHFWEQGLFGVLPNIMPVLASQERLIAGLQYTENYLHRNGVTTGAEPGGLVSKAIQDAQNAVLGDADNPFRFYFMADGKTMAQHYLDKDMIAETEKFLTWGKGKTSFLPKQVKLFTDGAIYSQTMKMQDGYLDGHQGEWIIDPDIFSSAFQQYWDAGYQIHVHQNGDGGLDLLLDVLQENLRRKPRKDHRTVIVHFGFSTSEQVKRIKDLGAIVSANPYYVTALADRYSEVGIGPERANQMVRLGEVERAGIPFSLHSDMPMAPEQPLFLMHTAVNRTTFSNRVAGAKQRVSRLGALKAVTINAAHSLRLDDQIGSIEIGKKANFTILEDNPLTIEADQIKNITVWGTMLEGKVLPVTKPVTESETRPAKNIEMTAESVEQEMESYYLKHGSGKSIHDLSDLLLIAFENLPED